MKTFIEVMEEIVPRGDSCAGCPKSDPHPPIEGYCGDYFCHLMEETMPEGIKQCGINMAKIRGPFNYTDEEILKRPGFGALLV